MGMKKNRDEVEPFNIHLILNFKNAYELLIVHQLIMIFSHQNLFPIHFWTRFCNIQKLGNPKVVKVLIQR